MLSFLDVPPPAFRSPHPLWPQVFGIGNEEEVRAGGLAGATCGNAFAAGAGDFWGPKDLLKKEALIKHMCRRFGPFMY